MSLCLMFMHLTDTLQEIGGNSVVFTISEKQQEGNSYN